MQADAPCDCERAYARENTTALLSIPRRLTRRRFGIRKQAPLCPHTRSGILDQTPGCLDGFPIGELGVLGVSNDRLLGQLLVPLLIRFHNAPMISGQLLAGLIEDGDRTPDDPPHNAIDTEPTIGIE